MSGNDIAELQKRIPLEKGFYSDGIYQKNVRKINTSTCALSGYRSPHIANFDFHLRGLKMFVSCCVSILKLIAEFKASNSFEF